jgi:hypothetical protein
VVLLHGRDDVCHRRIRSHSDDGGRPAGLGRIRHRIVALGNHTTHDVPIRDDADEPIRLVEDRNLTAIVLRHHFAT